MIQIQDNVMNWLLEGDNPPVRYLTLTNILNRPQNSSDARRAKADLMNYEATQAILSHADEFWSDDEGAYWKYTGKYWQLIFLGQFLADGKDAHVARGANDILGNRKWIKASGWQCLTANLLTALMRLGYGTHPLVVEETESLARRIVADGGIKCGETAYSLLSHCHMALPKLLLCFAEIPARNRSLAVQKANRLIVKALLAHHVYIYVPGARKEWQGVLEERPKRSDLPQGQTVKGWIAEQREEFLSLKGTGEREPKQGWLKFGFPRHYNSDILEAMYALATVRAPMTRSMRKPLQVIEKKMTAEGKWTLENTLNGKMWIDVEEKGKPSKWITYFALHVLRHYG